MRNKGKEAYQHLFQSVHLIPDFDLAAVKFLRELLYQFLKENKSKTLNGLKLEEAVIGDAPSLEDYNENIVRKMGEEARSLLLQLLPLVLRIRVGTVLLDPKDQSSEVYIEPYKASVEDFESPFPGTLDCSTDEITLLLKPGHYDILYKEDKIKTIYDKSFSDFMNLIFNNKEKEKEKMYSLSIKDKVHTVCCNVDLEKEAYKNDLITTNRTQDSTRYYSSDWIRCFCGRMLISRDLLTMFSSKEVDEIFREIKKSEKKGESSKKLEICFSCKAECSAKLDYSCTCGKFYHYSCLPKIDMKCKYCKALIEQSPASATSPSNVFKPLCCNKDVGSKSEYIREFVEYNLKRREGKEAQDETRLLQNPKSQPSI